MYNDLHIHLLTKEFAALNAKFVGFLLLLQEYMAEQHSFLIFLGLVCSSIFEYCWSQLGPKAYTEQITNKGSLIFLFFLLY